MDKELLDITEELLEYVRELLDVIILQEDIDIDKYQYLRKYANTTTYSDDGTCARADKIIEERKLK